MDEIELVKIGTLPEGTDYSDDYELPASTGDGATAVKKFKFGVLKSAIVTAIQTAIGGITQGPVGPRGATGATGPAGPQGDKGDKGDKGDQGLKGDVGPAGPTGPRGATGAKGDQGNTGDRGLQGPAGATGADGPAGPPGPAGDGFDMTAYIEASPTLVNEAAAVAADLPPFTLYKTPTGELRYKLPNDVFTYTFPFTLS